MEDNATDERSHHEFEEGEDGQQTRLIMWQGQEVDESQRSILQPVSGNGGRKLRGKAETPHGAKERSASLAALKLMVRKGADEKSHLEEWKADLLSNLTAEISQIHKAHEDAMEAQREEMERQREHFQFEIEMLGERIRELEMVNERPVQGRAQQGDKSTPKRGTPEKEPVQAPSGEKASVPSPTHQENSNRQRSYAAVAAAQPTQISSQPWTKVSYGNRKNGTHKLAASVKAEQRGRRILFPRKNGGQLKSEADLMLALNEALQKARVEAKVRFSRVRYAPSGSISALLTGKADATMLLPSRSNLLIRAAKTVDDAVVGVEVLEQWQRLKVHGMLLERYFGPGKMELLKREVESSTGIPLKATPRWLINEDRLKEQQKTNNKRGSAIVITVGNENVAKQLMASGLRFGGAVKKVEKFWDAGPGSVCMRCCGIGHERLGNCGNRPERCVMCAGEHQASVHQCGVSGCNKGTGKLCVHVVARCANCQGSHQANSSRCPFRAKAEVQARKNKAAKGSQPKVKVTIASGPSQEGEEAPPTHDQDEEASATNYRDEEILAIADQDMDTEAEEWPTSPGKQSSFNLEPEDIDHGKKF